MLILVALLLGVAYVFVSLAPALRDADPAFDEAARLAGTKPLRAIMDIAAIDIAFWELHARRRNISFARALSNVRTTVPAYGSGKAKPSLPIPIALGEHLFSAPAVLPFVLGRASDVLQL